MTNNTRLSTIERMRASFAGDLVLDSHPLIEARLSVCQDCDMLTDRGCRDCAGCGDSWNLWRNKIIYGAPTTKSRCDRLSFTLKEDQMSKIETVEIPERPGLYWASVRQPQGPMPGQMRMGPPTEQAGQPEPPETPTEDYNAILAVWQGPASSSFRAFLFAEQGESRRPVSKRDILKIGERIEVPQ